MANLINKNLSKIIKLFLKNPDKWFYQTEITFYGINGSYSGTIYLLDKLVDAGFVKRAKGPYKVYYYLNKKSPTVKALKTLTKI